MRSATHRICVWTPPKPASVAERNGQRTFRPKSGASQHVRPRSHDGKRGGRNKEVRAMSKGTGGLYLRGTTWWIRYSHRGQEFRESSESASETKARRGGKF